MTYLVSARRWRPQTFEDLIGQEHISRTLANAIRAGRVAHAFLFTGVRGVGKTTAARLLAKALNCVQGPTPTPCNTCVNCQEVTAGNAVDVLEIDGASNTGVDDVREIIENVRYQAAKSRFKIYIIDEVHMLSNSAFNALLKTLEEPPAHVKFIFATTDPHKLPATVQSRCQRYDFRRIPLRLVVERLRQIVTAERIEISDAALFLLAREGEGSMRDAQSLLDQVLAGATGAVQDAEVLEALGVADRRVIAALVDAIIARDAAGVLQPLDDVYQRGCDLRRFTRDLLEHMRNLAVAKVSGGALLPDLAAEEADSLRAQAARLSAEDSDRAFRILLETDEEVARTPYPKLVLEMALLRLAALPPLLPVDELLQRLGEIETRMRGAAPARPAAATQSAAPPAAAAPRAPQPSPVSAPAAIAAGGDWWDGFVGYVRGERATLAIDLAKCTPIALGEASISLQAPGAHAARSLADRDRKSRLEDLAARFFGRTLRIDVTAAAKDAVVPEPARRTGAELTKTALEDPKVQAALSQFEGAEIVEVRDRRPRRGEGT